MIAWGQPERLNDASCRLAVAVDCLVGHLNAHGSINIENRMVRVKPKIEPKT
jgi:hypothetical protein